MRPLPFPTVAVMLLAAIAGLLACDGQTAITEPDPGAEEPTQTTDGLPHGPLAAPNDTAGAELPSDVEIEVRQDLMDRWNAAVTAGDSAIDLHWAAFDQFPHPTYKGGSAEAYRAFAAVLLVFFQAGDNFDFLTRNRLFTLHLTYVFPSGASGLDTTFQALATNFAAPDGFGDIPLDVRNALQGIAEQIQSAPR